MAGLFQLKSTMNSLFLSFGRCRPKNLFQSRFLLQWKASRSNLRESGIYIISEIKSLEYYAYFKRFAPVLKINFIIISLHLAKKHRIFDCSKF